MQSFTFAPPALAPRENQRNYVFVDEHNRHKRLKVMRACEGCRRRKIKCDAATTNSWPCAACIRLKLNCVPPTVSYDKDFNGGTQTFELDTKPLEYAQTAPNSQHDYHRQDMMAAPHTLQQIPSSMATNVPATYAEGMRMYQTASYVEQPPQDHLQYASMPQSQVIAQDINYAPPQLYQEASQSAPNLTMTPPESDSQWRQDPSSNLAEALGELKIDCNAVAPYITNQRKTLAETPAQREFEVQLPPSNNMDSIIRIPPEMMPGEEHALVYFDFFFTNIHPYCPVINKAYFYQQWQSARESISPLLLEAIFACATLMMGEEDRGQKWLALASKHEESFKDVPRLSTMQAMLLLLKAREASPKRGYFWRSWMSVVGLVTMGKDLELDDHYELHQMGRSCGSTVHECITKTRIWQLLFVMEVMIGGPQGRSDLQVDANTVDFEMPRSVAGLDASEIQVARQWSQHIRIVKNVQQTIHLHAKLRKKSDGWALDPSFIGHNSTFSTWSRELPEDLQIVYPLDGSIPAVSSHFIANMHSYQQLAIIMHLRPQLHAVSDSYDGVWKQHMVTCYSAAKNLCMLQEAILKYHGLPGLLCMLRGISFTIYSVLTCTMLHLVAITCPDPELNSDAREFFVRHMRILETCTPVWPMPEMHQQVNNLRLAFSADITKPFELKPSFPFGSPRVVAQTSPTSNSGSYRSRLPSQHSPLDHPGQINYHTHPITPPISTSEHDTKADSPVAQSLVMMASGQRAPQPSTGMQMQEPVQWTPQPILDQWNTAFGTPPPSATTQSSPPLKPPPTGNNYELRTPIQESGQPNFQIPNVSPHSNGIQDTQQLPTTSGYAVPNPAYVSPAMWQEVVANSYSNGAKRRWDSGHNAMVDHSSYKRAR
ncbi:hypothetical protein DM02DRAFT_520178 [Periconia macrospinosa]|uniref:Zn(2)-C6 fungal-type domain-containing protein n=1 Tax=Periconia macrospinosa TaxID=97972 RepID=A0A2V1E3E2_9PLEO|nr:hypothetical protein DM02DRAFT_520178 [Periconia macrospinosa]